MELAGVATLILVGEGLNELIFLRPSACFYFQIGRRSSKLVPAIFPHTCGMSGWQE
jgi:hypothetical protein